MSINKILDYWLNGYISAWQTAKILYKNKRYSDFLFYCHLTLEKLLKALVVNRIKQHAPFIHDLIFLARKADVKLDKKQISLLEMITTFNISGRYAEQKTDFFIKFNNQDVAKKYYQITEDLIKCLKKELVKK